ncbi:hypothetical protein ABQE69_09155 [Mycolicibacillus trivialis]
MSDKALPQRMREAADTLAEATEEIWAPNPIDRQYDWNPMMLRGWADQLERQHAAAARALVPEMADEIERLRAEIREYIDAIKALCNQRDKAEEEAAQWKALWRDSVAEASAALEALDKADLQHHSRRIETVEQLDALPVGAVIKVGDEPGGIYEKDDDNHWGYDSGEDAALLISDVVRRYVRRDEITVLYTPGSRDA